jgi:DNA repair ATPase RecN
MSYLQSTNETNSNNATNSYEKNEKEIKENLEKIISLYFKEFLNKFDNLNNQLKFADVLLNAYHYRYQKLRQKFGNVGDILSSNYEDQVEFFQKLEKLERLDAKMTQVEIKLQTLNKKVENFDEKVEKIRNGNKLA